MNPALDSPLPKPLSSISSSLLNSKQDQHELNVAELLPLRRLSAPGCVVLVGASFQISSIPRAAGLLVPGDTDRGGDPLLVLFVDVTEFSWDLSSMFNFVIAAVLASISFCVVVNKTFSSSTVGSMWNVYRLTKGSETLVA